MSVTWYRRERPGPLAQRYKTRYKTNAAYALPIAVRPLSIPATCRRVPPEAAAPVWQTPIASSSHSAQTLPNSCPSISNIPGMSKSGARRLVGAHQAAPHRKRRQLAPGQAAPEAVEHSNPFDALKSDSPSAHASPTPRPSMGRGSASRLSDSGMRSARVKYFEIGACVIALVEKGCLDGASADSRSLSFRACYYATPSLHAPGMSSTSRRHVDTVSKGIQRQGYVSIVFSSVAIHCSCHIRTLLSVGFQSEK